MRFGAIVGRVTMSGAAVTGTVSLDATETATGTITISDDLGVQLQPRGITQRPGIEIRIDGIAIDLDDALGATISYSASLDSFMQTASFSLPLRDAEGVFGNPFEYHGPPFGTAPIDIDGVYLTEAGERRVPLLRNGIPTSIGRRGSPFSGYSESYSVGDYAARIDQRVASLILKPGHGLTRGRVVQREFEQIGVTKFRLEAGANFYKPVQLVGGDPARHSLEIESVEGRTLFFDQEAYLVNPIVGDIDDLPTRWFWDEYDILAVSDVDGNVPGDVLTDVTLTGSEQILRDPDEGGGEQPSVIPSLIVRTYAPVLAAYRQESNCTLTALTPVNIAREMVVSLVLTTTQNKGGVQVFLKTESFAHYYPERARYQYASGGVRNCIGGVYLLEGADPAGNGSEAAYSGTGERWSLTNAQISRDFYDKTGFQLTDYEDVGIALVPTVKDLIKEHLRANAIETSFKLGSITDTYGFYIRRAALKHRGPGDAGVPWDELDPITGRQTLGNGEAVTGSVEAFQRMAREVQTIEATPDGYLKTVTIYRFGFQFNPGNQYQLSGGEQVGSEFESLTLKEIETIRYVQFPDLASHAVISTLVETAVSGTLTKAPVIKIDPVVAGAPPPVDRLPGDEEVDETLYESDEEREFARIARDFESRPIKARYHSSVLEEVHPKRVAEQPAEWAENVEELAEMARRVVERSAAISFQITIPVNYDVRLAHKGHVTHHPLGIDFDVQVHGVQHSIDPSYESSGGSTTVLTLKKYPQRTGVTQSSVGNPPVPAPENGITLEPGILEPGIVA